MGKISVKENKTAYQLRREELGLTRDTASDATGLSPERIEKIENGKVYINPEDVVAMADGYKCPRLCNHYCSKECAIGKRYVPEVREKDLREITLELLASMNAMQRKKERLIEISVDNKVNPWEICDFADIQAELEKMSLLADTLRLWFDRMLTDGQIDRTAYEKYLSDNK